MLPGSTVPASLAELLGAFRGCFTAPSFATFVAMVVGLVAQPGRRTVCGMLAGAGLARAWSHHRARRFFSRARWSLDEVGARLIAARLAGEGERVRVAVDDTLFHRVGKTVFGAAWQHDGSAKGRDKVGRGNCFVVAAILADLPFCSRPVALPVLFRLWRPTAKDTKDTKGGNTKARGKAKNSKAGGNAKNSMAGGNAKGGKAKGGKAKGGKANKSSTSSGAGKRGKRLPANAAGPYCAATRWASQPTWPPHCNGAPQPWIATGSRSPSRSPPSPGSGMAPGTPRRCGSRWPAGPAAKASTSRCAAPTPTRKTRRPSPTAPGGGPSLCGLSRCPVGFCLIAVLSRRDGGVARAEGVSETLITKIGAVVR
jgi:DDE superfamily endonuclease